VRRRMRRTREDEGGRREEEGGRRRTRRKGEREDSITKLRERERDIYQNEEVGEQKYRDQ